MVAPYDQDERVREKEPAPLQYTSYMPEVQRVAPPRVQKRRKRRRMIVKIPWIPISVVVLLVPVVIGAYLVFGSLRTERRAESPLDTESAGIIYITATPDISIAQTATSVLPADYLESLLVTPSAMPTGESALEELQPTPTIAFVNEGESGGPVFDMWRSKIVYAAYINGNDEIFLMNVDGTDQRQLTSLEGTDWYPSLSPDGQTIYWSSQRGNGNFDIYSMDVWGGNVQQLTRNHGHNYAPELSPDGTRIVFTSTAAGRGDQDIWVMNADGSNPHQVTFDTTNEIDPSWAPDGTMISFTSNRTISNELFIMNADGSNVRQMTRGMSIGGRNDWSPDGQWLTFYAGPGSEKEIFIVPFECVFIGGCDYTVIRQLTYGGQNKGPAFSPDGQWITFTSGRDGDNEIMIMRIDGSDMRTLTSNHLPDWMPRWGP